MFSRPGTTCLSCYCALKESPYHAIMAKTRHLSSSCSFVNPLNKVSIKLITPQNKISGVLFCPSAFLRKVGVFRLHNIPNILPKKVLCHFSDYDECSSKEYECQRHTTCVNTDGSYKCQCKLGFFRNGPYCIGKGQCQYKQDFFHSGSYCIAKGCN